MYTSNGKIYINERQGVARILVDYGLILYYQNMVHQRWFGAKTNRPKHGGHITIINPKIHKTANLKKIKYWKGKTVEFQYDPYIHIGGSKDKGFFNFWLKVDCPLIQKIKDQAGAVDSDRFLGDHITICNTKNL